jgi:predicted RNase H-like HicB family nuclease
MANTKLILGRPYTRLVTPDPHGGFTAEIREFPGCVAEGDTANAALDELEVTASEWITFAIASGYEIPQPIEEPKASIASFSSTTVIKV